MTSPSDEITTLTITLNRREFDMAVRNGMAFLHVLGEIAVVRALMPWPEPPEIARRVATLGVQEVIASITNRRNPEASDDPYDDIPF